MQRLLRVYLTLVALLLFQGCGSGFVDGWVDREHGPQGTDEEQCARRKKHVWVDGACKPNGDLSLGDELPDTTEAPRLTLTGALRQTTVVGKKVEPLRISLSAGAFAALRQPTCGDYLRLEKNELVSSEGFSLTAGQTQCEVDVVATVGRRESEPVHVVIAIEPGFFTACTGHHPNADATRTTNALILELRKPDCVEAFKALREIKEISLTNHALTDLSPLSGLTKLEWLALPNERQPSGALNLAPIASLTSIITLDLRNNRVESLASLAKLPKLNFLFLEGTPLATGEIPRTSDNCPHGEGVNAAVTKFCKP